MIKRRITRTVKIGGIKIGSGYPIRIQSMTKCDTRDIGRTVAEIKRLEKCGCEIVRVAVKDILAAEAIKSIKKRIKIPLVADIHFDWRLALEAVKSGADKIRINPGNMAEGEGLTEIIKFAKKRRVPVRIGLNSGSVNTKSDLRLKPSNAGRSDFCVKRAIEYIKLFEKENFHDIIISLKSSNVEETVASYRKLAALCDYPFHLGVTAAGSYDSGIVKSAVGIGALLLDGIGDTIRVSLTGDPVDEVKAAKKILASLKLRNFGPEIISCPTCGRCQVDLVKIVREVERALDGKLLNRFQKTTEYGNGSSNGSLSAPKTIAIMGCEVNGPGEAKEADIGVAFGKDFGMLFKKGKIVKKIKAKNTVKELVKIICAGRKL